MSKRQNIQITRIQAVIFDLDNVLFDERDYNLAAYHNIAKFLSERYFLDEKKIFRKLVKDSRRMSTMYSKLFNDLLRDLRLDQQVLSDLLEIFAETKIGLNLRVSAEKVLINLKKQMVKLGLLTNGTVKTQMNKVQLLGIENYFDAIVYARELGRENEKPNPACYLAILTKLGVGPEGTVCLGDNPYTDFWGAKKLGMLTVRLLKGEYKNIKLDEEYEADTSVYTLKEFYDLLEKIN